MEIEQLRDEINEIDDELVGLFERRMDVAVRVAQYKRANNVPVLNRGRERQIIDRVTGEVKEDLAIYTKILYSTLFDLSRSYQTSLLSCNSQLEGQIVQAVESTAKLFPQKAVVACQGIEGAYSQQACDKLFSLPNIMYFSSFDSVFGAVANGLCRYGILPIENSSYGSVNEVYDLMKKHSFFIARSLKLKIDHALLSKHGVKLAEVKEIFSHEQAIGQCKNFLSSLEGVKITPVENTAFAAKLVLESGRSDVAAISSQSCAELYGLSVLRADVANSDSNYTRFICISKELEIYPGANKISIMMSLPHSPGALYMAIAKFSALGLNLCKIESRPIAGTDFEFMFYFDMDASIYSPEVLHLLGDFQKECVGFTFLGSYSEG
ncbi:MAG: chorismate mutase [Oscillospiraceae bacterium]